MKLREISRGFWDGKAAPFAFFLFLYSTGISTGLWTQAFPDSRLWQGFFLFLVPLATLTLLLSPRVARLFARQEADTSATLVRPVPLRAGLVVLVSGGGGVETAKAAIAYHAPALQHLWLVQSDSSRSNATLLLGLAIERHGLRTEQVHLVPLSDTDFEDPERVHQEIEEKIYGDLPDDLDGEDIILDVTGGAKMTTAGAFLSGLPRGRYLQITSAKTRDAGLRGTEPGEIYEIRITREVKPVRR